MNALNINSYHSPTKFLQPANQLLWLSSLEVVTLLMVYMIMIMIMINLTTYTILSLFSLQVELAPRLLSPYLDHPYLPHYKSPTALSHMHHLICGISSFLHSVNLILFTVLLVHLIVRISPHHSHHLHSHHLSLPLHFTPDLKLISFTNPFLHSHSYSFRTDSRILPWTELRGTALF